MISLKYVLIFFAVVIVILRFVVGLGFLWIFSLLIGTCGIIFFIRSKLKPPSPDAVLVSSINALLKSPPATQHKVLTQLASQAQNRSQRVRLRNLDVTPVLLNFLATHPSDPSVALPLLEALIDLCAEKEINHKIAERSLKDFLYYASEDNKMNVKLREQAIKALVNLTLDERGENNFREEGGIPEILKVLKKEHGEPDLLYQCLRLLINLAFNVKNREVITNDEEVLGKLGNMLEEYISFKNNQKKEAKEEKKDEEEEEEEGDEEEEDESDSEEDSSDDDENQEEEIKKNIGMRVVRLIGVIAQTANKNVYAKVATAKVGHSLATILVYEESDKEFSKYVVSTVATILKKGNESKATDGEIFEMCKGFAAKISENNRAIEIVGEMTKDSEQRVSSMAQTVLDSISQFN